MGDEHVPTELPDGSVLGPDGEVYRRTDQRVRRRAQGQELITAGSAVLTDIYPDGWTWYSGAAAAKAWTGIAPRLVSARRSSPTDLQWVGHIWMSETGRILLRFDGEH